MIKVARVCLSQQNMLISNAKKASGGGGSQHQPAAICIEWRKSKHVLVICQNHVTIFVSFILFAKEKQGVFFFSFFSSKC